MKKLLTGILVLFTVVTATAQQGQYNDPNVEVRNVSGFTGVKVATGIELVLSQGNTEAVAVSAADVESRNMIVTEVKDGVLKIYFDNRQNVKWKKARNLKAYVSAVTLKLLHASSGASVKIEGAVKANTLDVDLSSGAMLNGAFNASDIKLTQNSGSIANVNGTVQNLRIDVSSGAKFRGYDIAADKCDVDVSSGGAVEVTVNKTLEADASSGGSVRYKGACTITKAHTSSGGSVKSKA